MLSLILDGEGGFQLPLALIGILVFILAFPFRGFTKWDNAVKFDLLNFQEDKKEKKIKKLYRFKFLGAIFFHGKKVTEVDLKSGGLVASSSQVDSLLAGTIARPVFFIQCAFYFFGILGIVLSALYEFSGEMAYRIVMIIYMVAYAIGYCVVSFIAVSKEREAVEMWKRLHPSGNKK